MFGVIKQIYHIGRGICEKYHSQTWYICSMYWYPIGISIPNDVRVV